MYIAVAPKEAIANLKQRLTEKLNEELNEADVLANLLSPIYESAEKPDNLEVGYIITGQKNIINRMKTLIGATRKEITLFVAYPELFKELNTSLRAAKERKVKLNVAMTEEMLKTEDVKGIGDLRQLCCDATLVISDLKTLITVSDWTLSQTAMLSQDQNLIRMARDYFENSMCYNP
jgi:sugar-specific transcriptional regulator TrmB